MTLDEWLAETRKNITTQDNACTAHPMFTVQQKRRLYGFDPEYGNDDSAVWLYDDECVEPDEYKQCALDAYEYATNETPKGYRRVHYMDTWEFVTACFTEAGCKDYIKANGHNLHEPRIFVESGHRNLEWQRCRAMLAGKWGEK
jgi:hypothetical protein